MKSALYHQEGKAPQPFAILKKHDDGTVDLGPADGAPVITRCKIVDAPSPGFATVEKAEKPAPEKPADPPKEDGGDAKTEKPAKKK